MGDNGVGKSTLARILAGTLDAHEGHVVRRGQVLFLPQFSESLDGAKDFSSGGEKRMARLRTLFAKVERFEQDGVEVFVILDEPTNDLDRSGRAFVIDWVRARRDRLLIISHDHELLEEVDDIVELSSLGLRSYGGGFKVYLEASQRERAGAAARADEVAREFRKKKREKHEKLETQERRSNHAKKVASETGMARILVGARKRRAQKTSAKIEVRESKRVETADRGVREAQSRVIETTFLRLNFQADARPVSQVLILADSLQLKTGPRWPKPLTFQFRARDRLWIRGRSGLGKTSLVEVLRGRGRPTEGALTRAAVLSEADRIGFLDQNQSSLVAADTVLETVGRFSRFSADDLRHELSFYGFTGDRVFLRVEQLSGGERLRLALAQIFLASRLPLMLILDEPTNNLDFRSLELLRVAIEHFSGGIFLITHDETFGRSLDNFETWDLESDSKG